MKKIFFILFVLLARANTYANKVSVSTAQLVAYHYFLQGGGVTPTGKNDFSLVYTSGQSTINFYVFSDKSSFVIVSGDDRVIPILGYSPTNNFDPRKINPDLSYVLSGYASQIQDAISQNLAPSDDITNSWNNLINNDQPGKVFMSTPMSPMTAPPPPAGSGPCSTTTITYLMATPTWDQSPNYNADCPFDSAASTNCVTGCVATCMSELMKYWNWPCTGSGSHSYTAPPYGTQSVNFGSTTYDWPSMPETTLAGPNAAVATLMYDAGVSVNMQYSPYESGAWVISADDGTPPYCAEYALKTFFNYSSALHGEFQSSYSTSTWISMLETDIGAWRPVIYAGWDVSGLGGHCFLFDGYQNTSTDCGVTWTYLFHINWGWSDSSNGYYAIGALNPSGEPFAFNHNDEAIFNIQPNYSGFSYASACGCPNSILTVNQNAQITSGGIFYYGGINAGSSFGVGGDPLVTVNSANSTEFLARYIRVHNNFIANMSSGHFFEIKPTPECGDPGGGSGRHADVLVQNNGTNASNNTIQVYPNPATGEVTIAYPCTAAGQMDIDITDISGRLRYTESVACSEGVSVEHTVDLSGYAPGVYFIGLTLNGQHVVKKIVKLSLQ